MTTPHHERPEPVEIGPDEEDIDAADAAERIHMDPDEQPNRTDEQLSGEKKPGS